MRRTLKMCMPVSCIRVCSLKSARPASTSYFVGQTMNNKPIQHPINSDSIKLTQAFKLFENFRMSKSASCI
mgnify:CR=1 FL=1